MKRNKRFGLIFRAFSSRPDLVTGSVEKVKRALHLAVGDVLGENEQFDRIDILVPVDKRFDDSDCGETASALRTMIDEVGGALKDGDFPLRTLFDVHEVWEGDIFCGLLNYGIRYQMTRRIDYSVIVSPEAASFITRPNMEKLIEALDAGAKVVGLALNELEESILEGRIADTFAVWDNVALMSEAVNGFDLMCRKNLKSEKRPNAGVEEIPPIIRLIELHGPCIAPVIPENNGAKWIPPTDPAVLERHSNKMESKRARQLAHAQAMGHDLEFIKAGVMPQYRTF